MTEGRERVHEIKRSRASPFSYAPESGTLDSRRSRRVSKSVRANEHKAFKICHVTISRANGRVVRNLGFCAPRARLPVSSFSRRDPNTRGGVARKVFGRGGNLHAHASRLKSPERSTALHCLLLLRCFERACRPPPFRSPPVSPRASRDMSGIPEPPRGERGSPPGGSPEIITPTALFANVSNGATPSSSASGPSERPTSSTKKLGLVKDQLEMVERRARDGTTRNEVRHPLRACLFCTDRASLRLFRRARKRVASDVDLKRRVTMTRRRPPIGAAGRGGCRDNPRAWFPTTTREFSDGISRGSRSRRSPRPAVRRDKRTRATDGGERRTSRDEPFLGPTVAFLATVRRVVSRSQPLDTFYDFRAFRFSRENGGRHRGTRRAKRVSFVSRASYTDAAHHARLMPRRSSASTRI